MKKLDKSFYDFEFYYEEVPMKWNNRTKLVRKKMPKRVVVKREFAPRLRDWWTTRRLYHLPARTKEFIRKLLQRLK